MSVTIVSSALGEKTRHLIYYGLLSGLEKLFSKRTRSVKSPVSSGGASLRPWPCPWAITVFRANGLTSILLFLKGEAGTGSEEEKGVLVL